MGGYVANVRDITERKEFEAAARPPGPPRSAHRPRQPPADPRPCRADAGPVPPDLSSRWPPSSSTSTTSRTPTTRSGTRPATSCCRRWPAGSPAAAGQRHVGRLGGDEFVILVEGVRGSRARTGRGADPRGAAGAVPIEGFEGSRSRSRPDRDRPGDRATPRISCVTPTSPSTGPRRPGGTAGYSSSRPCSRRPSTARARVDLESALGAISSSSSTNRSSTWRAARSAGGGPDPLAAPDRGRDRPRRLHPDARGHRADRRGRPLGAREACARRAAWHAAGFPITMSVNVSMRQLESDEPCRRCPEASPTSGLDPSSPPHRVTESTLMQDANATVSRLERSEGDRVQDRHRRLRNRLLVTGLPAQFPVDVLKIDRSFVAGVDGRPTPWRSSTRWWSLDGLWG